MKTKMTPLSKFYVALIMIFLYAPIVVMIVFSFNSTASTSVIGGFSLRWYKSLLHDSGTMQALANTLILAVSSSFIATVMGTAAAVGINTFKNKRAKQLTMGVTNIPMMNPEIVTGISMMLLFVFCANLIGKKDALGFTTMLIAHVTFNLPMLSSLCFPSSDSLTSIFPKRLWTLAVHPYRRFSRLYCLLFQRVSSQVL